MGNLGLLRKNQTLFPNRVDTEKLVERALQVPPEKMKKDQEKKKKNKDEGRRTGGTYKHKNGL